MTPCPRCQGTGEVTPLEGPTEVCACQDEEAKEIFANGNWADLIYSSGDLRLAVRSMIEDELPARTRLESDLDITIAGEGTLTPHDKALIQDVIAAVNAAAESVK